MKSSPVVQSEGWSIMPVSGEAQLKYACNCLNLGGGRIIAVHKDTARAIANWTEFDGHVQYIDFSHITSMYGAVHCGLQVVSRVPIPNSVNDTVAKRKRGE